MPMIDIPLIEHGLFNDDGSLGDLVQSVQFLTPINVTDGDSIVTEYGEGWKIKRMYARRADDNEEPIEFRVK